MLLVFALAGCVRSASRPPAGISAPPAASVPASVEAGGPLVPAIVPSVPDYWPLTTGTTWIYRYEAYSGEARAVWRVSESVIYTGPQGGYWTAHLERRVTLEQGDLSAGFPSAPEEADYWLVVDGSHIYRTGESLDLQAVPDAWLELVYPPPAGCWFPDPQQRRDEGQVTPPTGALPGCRAPDGPAGVVVTPAGIFERCLKLATPYNNGPVYQTFCPGIGMVAGQFDHLGTPFGYSTVLTGYLLPAQP